MKTRRIWTLLILSVISITLIIYSWMDISRIFRKEASDTVIIGRADGPTSILVIDNRYNYLLYGITFAFIMVTLILSLIYGHQRKKTIPKIAYPDLMPVILRKLKENIERNKIKCNNEKSNISYL